MKFKDINLRPEIHAALEEMGYVELSPIQEKTFLPIVDNQDIVALAETGSGKTGACGVPLIQLVDEDLAAIQVVILVPTRELALQYVTELDSIAQFTKVRALAVYGGVPISGQLTVNRSGVHLLVATPGRLIDLIHTGQISFREVRTVVLDEADEMLDMGFLEDVEFILSCILTNHQTLLFSATMPREIEKLIHRFLHNQVRIELNSEMVAPSSLVHVFEYVPSSDMREDVLLGFLQDRSNYRQVLIFCNSRFKGEDLYHAIRRKIPRCVYLHGGMEQDSRTRIFDDFKQGTLPILLATDVAARGLDFSNVSHVINFEFPRTAVSYTHRTGRTGRMGRKGTALSFVTSRDLPVCFDVIRDNHLSPEWLGKTPTENDIDRRRPRRHFRR